MAKFEKLESPIFFRRSYLACAISIFVESMAFIFHLLMTFIFFGILFQIAKTENLHHSAKLILSLIVFLSCCGIAIFIIRNFYFALRFNFAVKHNGVFVGSQSARIVSTRIRGRLSVFTMRFREVRDGYIIFDPPSALYFIRLLDGSSVNIPYTKSFSVLLSLIVDRVGIVHKKSYTVSEFFAFHESLAPGY